MLGVSGDKTKWEDNPIWNTMQTWEVGWYWNIFVKNKKNLWLVDYCKKFPIANRKAVNDLVKTPKIVYEEFRLPKKIVSDADMNFTAEMFRQFGS